MPLESAFSPTFTVVRSWEKIATQDNRGCPALHYERLHESTQKARSASRFRVGLDRKHGDRIRHLFVRMSQFPIV